MPEETSKQQLSNPGTRRYLLTMTSLRHDLMIGLPGTYLTKQWFLFNNRKSQQIILKLSSASSTQRNHKYTPEIQQKNREVIQEPN